MKRDRVRVAVTRDEDTHGPLSCALRKRGLVPVHCPVIRHEPPEDAGALQRAARELESFDWLVVASQRAVEAVVKARAGLPFPHRVRTAAAGAATAAALRAAGARDPVVAAEAGAEPLARRLREMPEWQGRRVLLPRAAEGSAVLAEALRAAGAHVVEVTAYRTLARPALEVARAWDSAAPDAVVLASPSAVHALAAGIGAKALRELRAVVAIGPTTAAALAAIGVVPGISLEADFASAAACVRELLDQHPAHPSVRAAAAAGEEHHPMNTRFHRGRRLRRTEGLRRLACETRLSPDQLVAPLFVCEGTGQRQPIASLPGHARLSVDVVAEEAAALAALGVGSVLLFGIPAHKDAEGSAGRDPQGVVPRAIRAIKQRAPGLVVWADVCLCEYTDHGHCGVLRDGEVDNDATLPLLASAALAYARAGADVVAPSDMMDGRVACIREALDAEGFSQTAIVSYAVKYASAFYGPFRDAAGSTPRQGDRRGYQMDAPNVREALREARADVAEGADALIVKPGMPYLDVVRAVRHAVDVPVAVYQVSGEYAMMHAAAERGWLDLERAMWESTLGIRRAGGDLVITYFARSLAESLAERRVTIEARA